MRRILLLAATLLAAAPRLSSQTLWEPSFGGLERLTARSIIAAPDGMVYVGSDAGFFSSSDNGTTWMRADLRTRSSEVLQLIRTSTGVLIAKQHDNVLRSVDNGRTWSVIATKAPPKWGGLGWSDILVSDSGLVAWTEEGLRRSTDDGATWQWVLDTVPGPVNYRTGRLRNGTAGEIYIDVRDSVLYRLHLPDGTVERVARPVYLADEWEGLFRSTSGAYYATRRIEETIEGTTYTRAQHMMRSTDGGATWSLLDSMPALGFVQAYDGRLYLCPHRDGISRVDEASGRIERVSDDDIWRVAFTPDGTMIGSNYAQGMVRSRDGRAWESINAGLANARVDVIAPAHDGAVLAAYDNRLVRSTDDGRSWQVLNDSLGVIFAIHTTPSGVILAGTYQYYDSTQLTISTDDGRSWQPFPYKIPGAITTLAVTRRGVLYAGFAVHETFATDIGSLFRSDDGGWTWTRLGIDQPIRRIVEARDGAVLVATHTFSDMGSGEGYVFRSIDDGRHWDTVLSNRNTHWIDCAYDLAVDRDGRVFTSGGSSVFRSTDHGRSWTPFAVFDPNDGKRWATTSDLAVDSLDNIYVLRWWGGLYRSSDAGETWAQWDFGIDDDAVTAIATAASGTVFAGTYYRGLFKLGQASRNEGVPPSSPAGGAARIEDPTPNPVTDGATIDVVVTEESYVSVIVTDVLGREIGSLLDGWRRPGRYQLRLDAAWLADGTYHCTLETEGVRETKRFIVQKGSR
jgi:photosystem II stability/assembly factor-like uncharacterized protein